MFLYGYPSDILSYIYGIWALKNGVIESVFPNQIVFIYLLTFLSSVFSSVLAMDWLIFIILLLGFSSSYFLVLRFSSRLAAFFSALSYTFSQFFLWHAMQNPEIVLASAFVPLYLWGLVRLDEVIYPPAQNNAGLTSSLRNKLKYPLLGGFIFALIFLSSFYIGYLSLIFTVGFFLYSFCWNFLVDKIAVNVRKLLWVFVIFASASFILTLPGTYSLFEYRLGRTNPEITPNIQNSLERSSLLDLVAYSARPWDYFLPSINHPIFGQAVKGFYESIRQNQSYQFWSTFLPERVNFLGYTVVLLGLIGFVKALKEPDKKVRKLVLSCAFLGFLMFLISLPPVISVKGTYLYLPSYFLFKILPMFRVYTRAGVFVLLCFVVLGGYGLKKVIGAIKENIYFTTIFGVGLTARKSVVLTTIISGVVLFENLNFPPFPVMDVSRVPQVYQWVKEQPGDILIAEYPRDSSVNDLGGGCPSWLDKSVTRDWNGAYENFYRVFHNKRVFDFSRLEGRERAAVADLSQPFSYDLLQEKGVAFVVLHTREPLIGIHPWPYPQENPLDECWRRRVAVKSGKVYGGFSKIAEFDDGVIYKVQ